MRYPGVFKALDSGGNRKLTRHFVMPFAPLNADNMGIVLFNECTPFA
jgi:hypothetical protein